MRLTSPSGETFTLQIVGYQFQDPRPDEYDANWLRIQIAAANARGRWTAVDPSLLTWEVIALADWLECLAAGITCSDDQEFIEPNLCFRVVGADRILRVYFELESRPPWAPSNAAPEDDLWLSFPIDAEMLLAAAGSLRDQLQRYPRRGAA
jgi:hypothetical protein